VDTGGTFTDFVLFHQHQLRSHKCLSTPDRPEQAILNGIRELGLSELIAGGNLVVVHGSTVATNAALEGKGVRTVFISNRGFADMLSIGRQTRADLYNLRPPVPLAPVSAELCLETGGRIGADGRVIEPLTTADITALQQQIETLKPQAVAINLLFSFIDDGFEKAIAEAMPEGVFVSRSSEVLPEYKEYERGMATWLNAWLGPKVADYLGRLQAALKTTPLAIMQSSGGTTDAVNAGQRAVNLLLSGPAGGLAAVKHLGDSLARPRIMSFDMGGTSSDVALINGDIKLTNEGSIGPYPVAVPMVDMHTIGAGGGSLAYIDEGGMLRVGPESAGADPGPACYNKGGVKPTVTDANIVLGRLPANAKLGGSMPLNLEAARRAVATLAAQLELSIEDAAAGIIAIANEHMVRALRVISVQRGHDPSEFSLCCFGGAGGLHVCALADALGCPEIIVPNYGGVFSAMGMLLAPKERQLSRTINAGLESIHTDTVVEQLQSLAATGRAQLRGEGVKDADITEHPSVDLCYRGQSYTLNLPWQSALADLEDAFHHAHEQRYGHQLALPVQLINIRQALRAATAIADLPSLPPRAASQAAELCPVFFANDFNATPRYMRNELASEQFISGPALISEAVATTWLAEGWQAKVDDHGHLLIRRLKPDMTASD
jgi:N-methylhydantoinase A